MALFSKTKKDQDKKAKKRPDIELEKNVEENSKEELSSVVFSGVGGAEAHKILKGFYVSEKASIGANFNQYTFRVFKNANKSEVKKEVNKLFNVKVKSVRILNMPEKRRDFGRHPGSKSGFKKAIVILEKGHAIGQAKP